MRNFFRHTFFTKRTYLLVVINVIAFIGSYFFTFLFYPVLALLFGSLLLILTDILLLYSPAGKVNAFRFCPERLSNGDRNEITVVVTNSYSFKIKATLIDEVPVQFQWRDFKKELILNENETKQFTYQLVPKKRGEYGFGALNVFVSSVLFLCERRFVFDNGKIVPVYPSFIQMRQYELLAIHHKLSMIGVKRVRRIGNSREFDQIREYVRGDDVRTVNWKATSRKNRLMVNTYQDERSQQVISIIDMGRSMKMPFQGMTLLDYAINASLVISNIAWMKHDKPGLITFSDKVTGVVKPERRGTQMMRIMDSLYRQQTQFNDSMFDQLAINVKRLVNQRSLLLLFTNFESLEGMRRQMRFLRRLAREHVLVVIYFKNSELNALLQEQPTDTQHIYRKVIASKFDQEKEAILTELKSAGIHGVYTQPQDLTVNTINKYLEIKSRNLI